MYVRSNIAKTIVTERRVDSDDEGWLLILEMPGFALINVMLSTGLMHCILSVQQGRILANPS
jgi:hypothetical protein